MDIVCKPLNDVYLKVECEPGIALELSDYFTFKVPGYKFMPAYRNKFWSGDIKLFNAMNKTIYVGLLSHIQEFARQRDYTIEIDPSFADSEFSVKEAEDIIKKLKIPVTLKPREYQIEAFVHGVRKRRALLLSPTGSGKSLIIYLLTRYFRSRTLIIVPTVSLVHQMYSDFESYGFYSEKYIYKILSGVEKQTEHPVVISTWQSIYKMPKQWFAQFDVCIGDEAHLFKAKSLTTIMTKLEKCKHKFGFTGTLDGTSTHKLVLEGLFGDVKKVTTTAELIEQKHLSEFSIKAIVLQYKEEERKLLKDYTYHDEIEWIVSNPARNRFITNLALSLKGNTLLLFKFVEKHGEILYNKLNESKKNGLFFVHGGVEGEEREDIRKIVDANDNAIIVASFGTFSTGVNIKNLHNIIFASPSKSRIRNLQSIGRGLRTSQTKTRCVLYDIADDLSWKSRRNHTLNHFSERIAIYNEEKFQYKIYNVELTKG
jgi:superfamily II DNA or RNA helicase